MKFWYGSGPADPYLRLMDPDSDLDPDPAVFVSDLQDAKKYYFKLFFCLLHFEGTFTSYFKDKKIIKSHKTVGINVFLTIFD
jgi:hypothetical protein